jgi:phage virion morphogenesis protein
MSVDFAIRAEGQDQVEQTLAALVGRFGDVRPLMERFGIVLETSTIERFDDETAPDGSKWLPSLRAQEEGGKTLTDTARLKQSIRAIAGADTVQVGTNVVYARRHQEGFEGTEQVASHKRVIRKIFGRTLSEPIEVVIPAFARTAHTPARPFLGLSTDDREELGEQAADYLAEVAPEIEP